MPDTTALADFGQIDIYLFDQLLKGRIQPGMRIVDAGCGEGRNLVYFLKHGYDVYGVDADPFAIQAVRDLAQSLAPHLPSSHFQLAPIEAMPFDDHFADVVLCSAVLHFARDDEHFTDMLHGAWRVLKPGGLFFSRLASVMGIEAQLQPIQGRRHHLPDGSERYLVDDVLLERHAAQLGGIPADPLKTTIVHGLRSMTTWVLTKKPT